MKYQLKQLLKKLIFTLNSSPKEKEQRKFIIKCGDHIVKYFDNLKKQFDPYGYFFIYSMEWVEYKVLDTMIKDDSIEYINKLLVEFHHRKYLEIAGKEEYGSIVIVSL